MIRLPESLKAWGAAEFCEVFKQEFERVDAVSLPLQQGLARSSHVSERPFQVLLLGTHEGAGTVQIKAGIFYAGIIAGCSCADDPTPIDELTEYCVVQISIDRTTGDATVTLLEE